MNLGGKNFTISRIHIIQCQERHKKSTTDKHEQWNYFGCVLLKKNLLETTIIAQKVYFGMFCFFATLCNNWGLGEQWAQSSSSSSSLKELQHHLDWHFVKKTKQFAALKVELIWNCFDLWMVPKIPRYTLSPQGLNNSPTLHSSQPGCSNHNQSIKNPLEVAW